MRVHSDWSTSAFDLPPVAEAVGPFVRAPFLRAASDLTDGTVRLVEGDGGLWALTERSGRLEMAGDADLTDYHSPLGEDPGPVLTEYAQSLEAGLDIEFDSLPLGAAELAVKALDAGGIDASLRQHEVAAVVELPDTFDAYLDAVGKKQRHEIRRKRRRYEDVVGAVVLERHDGAGWGFDEFVRLHRMADGEKGEFMTDRRLGFFESLASQDGWVVDLLRHPESGAATACAFSFVGKEYWLYNSSYDPDLSDGSPGVALLGALIERAIEDRCTRFDFLKGDEVYKFRMGASERPLYVVSGRR